MYSTYTRIYWISPKKGGSLKLFKSFAGQLFLFVVTVALAWAGTRHFFGKSQITATVDGKPLVGCSIRVDDKRIGETPYETRLPIGSRTVEIVPPRDFYDTEQEKVKFYVFSLGVGTVIKAEFDTREELEEPIETSSR